MKSTCERSPSAKKVSISLDADPSKKLQGTVTHIANVGEAEAESGFEGLRGEDRDRQGGHHAAARYDDGNEIETASIRTCSRVR
jgi:hypothetical protein